MKKGLWNLIGKVPVLVLAVAVGPVAMADGPMVQSGSTAPPATPGQSGPIQTIAYGYQQLRHEHGSARSARACGGSGRGLRSGVRPGLPTGLLVQLSGVLLRSRGGLHVPWSPDKWCNVGLGIRTSVNEVTSTANVSDRNYFAVDEARLFFTGKVTSVIGFELNTDISGAGGYGFHDSRHATCRTRSTCSTRSSSSSSTTT